MGTDAIFLAFDYGTRNIGVAVGQRITNSATALPPLVCNNNVFPWNAVDRLVKNWKPEALIVGVPHRIQGGDLKITMLAERFISQLEDRYGLLVHGIEEMLTTKSARAEIFKRGGYRALQSESVDSVAARIILEAWMNEQGI